MAQAHETLVTLQQHAQQHHGQQWHGHRADHEPEAAARLLHRRRDLLRDERHIPEIQATGRNGWSAHADDADRREGVVRLIAQ